MNKLTCKDCSHRAPYCWDSCAEYKAWHDEQIAAKAYLRSFSGTAAGNRLKIISIAERKERKKHR